MSNKRRKIKILTLSWNMGNARADEFGRAIPHGGGDNDLIVLGLQEATWSTKKDARKSLDPSLTVSMTKDNETEEIKKSDPVCVKQLLNDLNEVLGPEYVLVVRNRNVQMQQLIYAKSQIKDRITKIEKFSENTGFFHVFPNKGGLRISFTIDQTSIAFLSCHLTAHEGVQNCALRNDSIQEILDGVLSNELFHHVIFMGDMNYRITFDPATPTDARTRVNTHANPAPVPQKKLSSSDISVTDPDDLDVKDDEEDAEDIDPNDSTREEHLNYVYDNITQENWSLLLQYDELNREIAANRVLKGYTALEPKFPPTFKRVRGKTIAPVHEKRPAESTLNDSANQEEKNYDLTFTDSTSEKFTKTYYDPKRMPSYTDRILIHSLPAFEENLKVESFISCEEISSSDHKPVIATFTLQSTGGLRDIMKYSSNFVTKTKPRYTTATSFRLKEMRGFDLSEMDSQLFGGKSDPYLVLSSDPNEILISKKLRTKVISHNLNPVWNDVIDFRLVTNDLEGLSRNAHLFLTVWDYDVTNEDDLIGTAVISLANIIQHFHKSRGSDMIINADLIRSGLYQGRIEAKLELIPPEDDKIPIFRKNETPMSLYDHFGGRQSELESSGGHKLQSGEGGCGCIIS